MKKLLKTLCIGLLAVVCALSLLLCACGKKDPTPDNPNQGIENPGDDQNNPPKPGDDDPPKPDDPTPPEKETYTVTFDMNGYGVSIAPKSAKEGETVEAPDAPSALYMTFDGWFKDADCTQAFDFSAPLSANVTAYAKWTPAENKPATGYSPDAPATISLDVVSLTKDIASGTTLYYTFTATAAGRYGFSLFSNDNVAKFDCVYEASLSTADELKENSATVKGEYNFYLTLQENETVLISVAVKESETISVDNPSDAGVSVVKATDEPIPDGMFLEGLYKGSYGGGYMTIYFKIKDRVNKIFTLDADAEGVTEGVFTYLDGVLTIARSDDWMLGIGTMTWEAPEDEGDPATIHFVGDKTSIDSAGSITFIQDIPAIELEHEQWIGEYEAIKENATVSTVRIGKKYVQVVNKDGSISAYFTDISDTYSNYAKFTDTEITFGGGTIVIRSEKEGRAEQIKIIIGGTSEKLALKTEQVVEIPYMLPLIKGATYTGVVTEGEEEKTYSLSTSSVFWLISGLEDTSDATVDMLDYDGNDTYYTKVTANSLSGSKTIGYYKFKLVYKDGKMAAELYEDDTLIVTLTSDIIDVSENTYALKDGENTGSINAETGYAYITVEDNKSYIFTGDVEIYKGVNLLKPGDDSVWKLLALGEMLDLDEGAVLAVKPTGEGNSFTFSAQFKPLRGSSDENPIEIEGTYTFTAQKNVTYFLKFVAPADGEYKFSSSNEYNHVGFCINGEWYANTEDGDTVLSGNNLVTKTMSAGDTLIIKVANNSFKNNAAVSFTLNVAVTYDFTDATALTLDSDISGNVDTTGIYKAEFTTEGVIGLEFNAAETIKIILPNGTVKNGKAITLNKTELTSGFKLVCSGEVSYTAIWEQGYEKNPYKLTMGGTGSASYTWRDVEGNGTYFTFTAPKAENYAFHFATEGAQYFIYDGTQHDVLTLELTEGQLVTFRTNKESSVTAATFSLIIGYDYFANITEISLAADQSETALTAGNHKVTAGALADSTQITFTSQSSFKILYTNGNEAESTEADGVHTLTVAVSQMAKDTVFRLEADGDVTWKVVYTLGTVKNPVKPTINAQTTVATTSNAVRYVTVTAPDDVALSISVAQYMFKYSFNNTTYYMYPTFTIVGDEKETKYGFATNGYTTNKNTVPRDAAGGRSYTLGKGETVTLKVQYLSPLNVFVPDLKGYPVTVYYSFADEYTTALDWAAASKTLSSSVVKVYKNANAEIASFKLTAEKAFTVYQGASATSTPAKSAATLTDGVYSITVSNRYFFLDFGENDSVAYAIAGYTLGTSQNPMQVTNLGDTNVSYTSAYTDGKYYVTVTVSEAGSYVLGVASGYTITGDGLEDGVVTFAADALTKTFTVISNSYTAGGDTVTATVAVSVNRKLETQTLTFNSAVGSEGAGTLALESGSAYIVGGVVVTESLDKYIVNIVFMSSATFSIKYPDDTGATAKAKDDVYTLSVTVVNAQKGFTLTAEGTVTYAIDWLKGSYPNPIEFSSLTANKSVSYDFENGVYVKVQNNTEYGWVFKINGEDGATIEFCEKVTDDGRQEYTDEQTATVSVIIPAGETWILKLFNAPDYDDVQLSVTIIIDFKSNATELEFGSDEETESTGTTTITSGNIYKVSDTIHDDVMSVVFKSESEITVTLVDGSTTSGTEASITVEEAKAGFHIVSDGETTYEIEWYPASAHNVVVLGVETKQITFRKGFVSHAQFTATEDGWYTFKINTAGYAFTLGDDETAITSKKEIELTAGTTVAIKISATTANPSKVTTVSMTVSYSETQVYSSLPADMVGKWSGSGTYSDPVWGGTKSATVTITLNEDGTASYSINSTGAGSTSQTLEFVKQADGTYSATYKQGSNTRTVKLKFEDGVISVSDSYYSGNTYITLAKA